MLVNTDAVVLNSRKYSDSSKISVFFTLEEGKVTTLAKGARSTKSKYGSVLEPLSLCNISYYRKQGRELQALAGAESIINLKPLYELPEHMLIGLALLESVNQAVQNDEKIEELFHLLKKSVILLNGNIDNPFSLFVYFQLQLAEILGFGMELTRDMIYMDSDGDINKPYRVSLQNGGIIHHGAAFEKHSFLLDINIINNIIRIASDHPEGSSAIIFTEKMKNQAASFMSHYFSLHLDRKFGYRSLTLLNIIK